MRVQLEKYKKFILILGCILVLAYRGSVLLSYNALNTDVDQTTLWYMTAAAAHFDDFQVNYPGQSYLSSIESYFAVPMYWLGIPLNICLPLASSIIWTIPFAVCFVALFGKKSYFAATMVFLLYSATGINADIITTMPRGFVPGVAISFLGVWVLLKNKINRLDIILSFILITIGFINNNSSIAIIAIGYLYFALYRYDELKKNAVTVIGSSLVSGIVIYYYSFIYYKVNALNISYVLKTDSLINLKAFKDNFAYLGEGLSDFSFVSPFNIPIVLIILLLLLIFFAVFMKEYKMLIIDGAFVLGTISFCFLFRVRVFSDTIFYRQSRMFLFVPLIFLFIIYCSRNSTIILEKYYTFITAIIVILCLVKQVIWNSVCDNFQIVDCSPFSYITNVNLINDYANHFEKLAKDNGCDFILIYDSDIPAVYYGVAAMKYEELQLYFSGGDRFYNLYKNKCYREYSGNILVYILDYDMNESGYIVPIDGVIHDILKQYGIYRIRNEYLVSYDEYGNILNEITSVPLEDD